MKVAYVVPRYGEGVIGGAETAARHLAERLVADLGWEVSVLTTRAVDHRTWSSGFPGGTSVERGVVVHRFDARGRDPGFDRLSGQLLGAPAMASLADGRRWVELQGPVSDELVDAVATTDAEVVAFYPYLYDPTVRGLPLVGRRAVFHPAAHDEPPLQLRVYRRVFTGAAGLVYHTGAERRLVERLFPVAATRHVVLGLGVDVGAGDTAMARAAVGLGDEPYVVFVARIDHGKGTFALAQLFAAYKRRRPGPLKLILAGPVVDRPPEHPDVVLPGEIDEATKWGLLSGAVALVQPSAYESFSIVLMEGWACSRPALVNGRSEVLREHCERSAGGLWFDGYATFEAGLDRLVNDAALAARLGENGRAYVDANYRWPALLERYRSFLEAVATRA